MKSFLLLCFALVLCFSFVCGLEGHEDPLLCQPEVELHSAINFNINYDKLRAECGEKACGTIVKRDDFASGEFWPRQVWQGLLVSAVLLVILGIGVVCTFQLQVPSNWYSKEMIITTTRE